MSSPNLDFPLDKIKRENTGQNIILRDATKRKNLANLSSLRFQTIELAVILLRRQTNKQTKKSRNYLFSLDH